MKLAYHPDTDSLYIDLSENPSGWFSRAYRGRSSAERADARVVRLDAARAKLMTGHPPGITILTHAEWTNDMREG